MYTSHGQICWAFSNVKNNPYVLITAKFALLVPFALLNSMKYLLSEQRRLKDEEYPLLVRVLLGPHEDVVRLFLMDGHSTPEVSSEVAQFLNLSPVECRAILNQYYSQEEREVARIKEK